MAKRKQLRARQNAELNALEIRLEKPLNKKIRMRDKEI